MHTPEQKKWNLACAEPGKKRLCTRQNEKREIWRVRSPGKRMSCTRQNEKSGIWRVRSPGKRKLDTTERGKSKSLQR